MTVTANRLLQLLADIERALPHLSATPATREVGSQVASGSVPGSRPPGDLQVLELTWWSSNQAVLPKLISWAVMICEERRDAGLDDDGPADAGLPEVCRYLRARVGYVITQAWADELEAEWAEMRGQLRRVPGSPLHREILERTRCRAKIHDVAGGRDCLGMVETRIRDHGRGVEVSSRCTTCGRTYDDEAVALALSQQQHEVDIVTAVEAVARLAADRLVITLNQVQHWASRGSVTRHGMRGRDQTYSLTELALHAHGARRRATLAAVGEQSCADAS